MNQHPDDQHHYEAHHHDDFAAHGHLPYHHDDGGPRRIGYWRRIGGGSLSVSIIIYALFVLVALFILLRSSSMFAEETPEFLPGGGGGGGGGEKLALKRQRAVNMAQPKVKLASVATNAQVSLPDTQVALTKMTSLTQTPVSGGGLGTGEGGGRGTGRGTGVGSGVGSGWGPGAGAGFISLPKIYQSRCSPAERAQKMRENGGSDECETAVTASLKWLQTKQNPDGSWGGAHKGGMTGLALLAYLGHCETPDSPQYGETVLKGITYLIELGEKAPDPFVGIFSTKPSQISSTYEHGIAAYALGEMYSFSKLGSRPIPGLREGFERGVQIIIEKQHDEKGKGGYGSWSYKDGIGYNKYDGEDLSVTGWQFQALKAAKHTNLKITGLTQAFKKAEEYFESKQTPQGGFGREKRGEHYGQYTLTGCGLLGLLTVGGSNAKISKGIRFLMDEIKSEPLSWNSDCYLYTWYYNTQAIFQKGGDAWKQWNDQMRPLILENQNKDGSYKAESSGEIGAASSAAAGGDADVYRTCLCTLMLEVYYRYLKVGNSGESGGGLMPLIK